jgi:hypothetical protein
MHRYFDIGTVQFMHENCNCQIGERNFDVLPFDGLMDFRGFRERVGHVAFKEH